MFHQSVYGIQWILPWDFYIYWELNGLLIIQEFSPSLSAKHENDTNAVMSPGKFWKVVRKGCTCFVDATLIIINFIMMIHIIGTIQIIMYNDKMTELC